VILRRLALLLAGAALVLGLQRALPLLQGEPAGATPAVLEARPLLQIGDAAPVLDLKDHLGRPARLGGLSSRWRIVTFFRKASSPW
jgi:hypothetical protein